MIKEREPLISPIELEIKNLKETKKISKVQFDQLRAKVVKQHMEECRLIHKKASLKLSVHIISEKDPCFDRVIIGGGLAATLVYAELSTSEQPLRIVALSNPNNPNTWPKEGERLMGQPAAVQTPQSLSVHSEDLVLEDKIDKSKNPYNYTVASNFSDSLIQTQLELNMPIIHVKAIKIESFSKEVTGWECSTHQHRILIEVNKIKKYIYTNAIDLCIGLGEPRRLDSKQIDPALEKKLIKEKRLVYAQDGDTHLTGKNVFYDSSAINAAWIAEILLAKSQPDASIQQWIARDGKSFARAKKLNRIIFEALESKKLNLGVGVLAKVTQTPDDKLQLQFTAPVSIENGQQDLTGQNIDCDHLVLSFGQTPHELTKDLTGFRQHEYEEAKDPEFTPIPIGNSSVDGSIVAWGAAATLGIGGSSLTVTTLLEKIKTHSQTLPGESKAPGGIYRSSFTVKQMAKQLRKEGVFPISSKSIHDLDLPDINMATHQELSSLFSVVLENPDEAKQYAKKVIEFRSKDLDPLTDIPGGIQHSLQLQSILPGVLLKEVQSIYFPFEALPEDKTGGKVQKIKVTHFNSQQFRLFTSKPPKLTDTFTQEVEDSFAFVSTASDDNSELDNESNRLLEGGIAVRVKT